jgi:16S rRNA (cytidine1402-2'-O)-methyltransferase
MTPSTLGTLFVVATPIGNLEDITLRALRVLREAHLIAAEDTRRTAQLLAHFAISTPTISFHTHNVRARIPHLVSRLLSGDQIALVTDAGTPGVSDPGIELVGACVEQGITVDPVPGASALLTAAVASGFPMVPLTFLGFPPNRSNERKHWFASVSNTESTLCFFESPHRIVRTIAECARCFGDRPIVVARELTKLHQEFIRGTALEIETRLGNPRGEFTILVGPLDKRSVSATVQVSDDDLFVEFGHLTDRGGLARRSAIAALAKKHGKPAREVYAAIERIRQSVE